MKGVINVENNLWELLKVLKNHKWVDLTHEITNDSPYWQGMPEGVMELNNTIIDFPEMNLNIQTHKFPGQFGTHIDYPGHFVKNARLAGDFKVEDTVLPLVVIDLSEKVKENNDYEISIDDIKEFEEKHGTVPEGSFVVFRSDWSKRWPCIVSLTNADKNGNAHSPGWPVSTLEFLFDERNIAGVGHETLDTDAAVTCAKNGDLVGERYILQKDKFQVEAMANLDKLPPVGAVIFIAAPRIIHANGLPVRAWAVIPE